MALSRKELMRRIYQPRDTQELRQTYDIWADDYDEDVARRDYRLPGIITVLVARYVSTGAGTILDAGAGTGILGEWLSLAGYRDLLALDMSPGMLQRAARRGVYSGVWTGELGHPIDLPDGRFAAVASAGAFGITHAPSSGFREMVRLTREGGHLVLSVRLEGIGEGGFEEEARRMERDGLWRRIETLGPFEAFAGDSESLYVTWIFQSLSP
ncbi:MAG: class I SAM-dependent methyltransferase [bacterium]|nr:class I SAM-dependent methyltransferase [bacterium]MDE0238886.1 class I SAM-dependent methyltransferase [bacterium]MDE0418675.1 class I SAM-dependent methyltransferase [bacterium]